MCLVLHRCGCEPCDSQRLVEKEPTLSLWHLPGHAEHGSLSYGFALTSYQC